VGDLLRQCYNSLDVAEFVLLQDIYIVPKQSNVFP